MVAHLLPITNLLLYHRQVGAEVVAPLLLEFIEHVGSPSLPLGLVGKDTSDSLAELTAKSLFVAAHGYIDKALGRTFIEKVRVGKTAQPTLFYRLNLFVEEVAALLVGTR